MTDFEEPEGRTFGKGQLDNENELAAVQRRLEALGSLVGKEVSTLGERVKKLEGDVSAVINGHNQGLQRVMALENNVFSDTGFNRITELAKRLTSETERINVLREGVASLSEQGNVDRDRVNGAWSAIAELRGAFESRTSWIQETSAEAQNAIERRLASIENELTALLTKQKPLDEVWTKRELFAAMYGSPMGDPLWPSKEHDDAVREAVLSEAERRVRDYMTGHFSEGTIGGVVEAIRRPTIPEPKLNRESLRPEIRYVTDHHFRFKAPDRRHCSYVVNREENLCGLTAERHLLDREMPAPGSPEYREVKARPIQDNPQA